MSGPNVKTSCQSTTFNPEAARHGVIKVWRICNFNIQEIQDLKASNPSSFECFKHWTFGIFQISKSGSWSWKHLYVRNPERILEQHSKFRIYILRIHSSSLVENTSRLGIYQFISRRRIILRSKKLSQVVFQVGNISYVSENLRFYPFFFIWKSYCTADSRSR